MLAANAARERDIRAQVKETNDDKARAEIRQNNKEACLYNAHFGDQFKEYDEEKDLYVSPIPFSQTRKPMRRLKQTVSKTLPLPLPALVSSVERV
ncbi:hypothetical protein KCU93_g4731, partial [Aureobasidium melanogenum]